MKKRFKIKYLECYERSQEMIDEKGTMNEKETRKSFSEYLRSKPVTSSIFLNNSMMKRPKIKIISVTEVN